MCDNKILYSFIIPVYNTVHYLERCLSSVCAIKNKNIEIIIIDDGSTDQSFGIYKRFAEIDNRICIVKKENGGVSSARNAGIRIAKGKWIAFIDSDDEIIPEVYDEILLQVNKTAQLWIVGFALRSSASDVLLKNKRIQGIWSGAYIELIKRNLFHGDISSVNKIRKQGINFNGPCAKLFLKKIILENDILFPENIMIGEDSIFMFEYLKHVKSISYTNECGYYYWQNMDSAMHRFQKGNQILRTIPLIRNILGEEYLADYGQCGVRYYLYALKMDWCSSKNPDSYILRRKEAIKWRNMPVVQDAFHYFKLSRIRWEAVPIALCAKMKCFFLCNLLLKIKEKL